MLNLIFFKLDVVVCVKNVFMEISCMYALENKEELSRDDMIENINDDISQYKAEGNYFKVLKRMFNVFSMNSNVSQMELLMKNI